MLDEMSLTKSATYQCLKSWKHSKIGNDLNKSTIEGAVILKQEMLQYVTNAPEGPLYATHLLIMLYLSVMFR